ncbi:MAG: ACT domain-containing protein, partial [Nocardioidaceae bacterium]
DLPDQSERWLGIERAQRLEAVPGWNSTVLAAAPLNGSGEIVVFGRRGGPEVLDSELARLGHLAVLAASVRAT